MRRSMRTWWEACRCSCAGPDNWPRTRAGSRRSRQSPAAETCRSPAFAGAASMRWSGCFARRARSRAFELDSRRRGGGETSRRADFRHRALQWNHAARTRVPGHGRRAGLASPGTGLALLRRPVGASSGPQFAALVEVRVPTRFLRKARRRLTPAPARAQPQAVVRRGRRSRPRQPARLFIPRGGGSPTPAEKFVRKYTVTAALGATEPIVARLAAAGRLRGKLRGPLCQEQTFVLAEQFSSMEHDGFRGPYLSEIPGKPDSMDRPTVQQESLGPKSQPGPERLRAAVRQTATDGPESWPAPGGTARGTPPTKF